MYRDTLFRLSTQDVSFNDRLSNGARRFRFFAGFALMYSVEFFCLSISKLMVLERMRDFASQRTGDDGTRATRRLAVAVKTVLWAVAALNAAGIVSSVVAAGYYFQSSALFIQSAAAYAEHSPSDNSTAIALQQRAADTTQNGGNALAAQNFCESGALLIIICAFIIVGGISARRFNNVRCDINPAVRHLRWQIVLTVVVVFITFLMRAVFALMLAFADGFQNDSDEDGCMGDLCDPVCNNVFSTMQTWLLYTPALQLGINVLSSPLALLVALWGMTSERTLQLMSSAKTTSRASLGTMRLRTSSSSSITSSMLAGIDPPRAVSAED